MELIVWLAVGIFVVAGRGPVTLDPATFATEAECRDIQRRAAEFAATRDDIVGLGQTCVPLTVRSVDAPEKTKPSLPKMSAPKPGFEIET